MEDTCPEDRETLLHSTVMCQVNKLECNLSTPHSLQAIPYSEFLSLELVGNFQWKTKYFLVFCSQFSNTWNFGYKGETPPSLDATCCYPCYFPSQAIQLTSWDLNSQFPNLQFYCQGCPVPTYMEVNEVPTSLDIAHNSNTPTEPFPLLLQQCAPRRSFLHCTGFSPWHCQKNWGYPKCQWSLLNGFAGILLREILSAHPMLVIFPLCRMKIHELKGKTREKPEILPILAGLGQLAEVTYSKCCENYNHDNNVQWNIFKLNMQP